MKIIEISKRDLVLLAELVLQEKKDLKIGDAITLNHKDQGQVLQFLVKAPDKK